MILVYDTTAGYNRCFSSWKNAYDLWYHNSNYYHYSFYLYNLYDRLCIPFQTQVELKNVWWSMFRNDFDCLHISRKDTVRIIYPDEDKLAPESFVRSYMIFDHNYKPVDIRDWDFKDVDLSTICPHYYIVCTGSKPHIRSLRAPSMIRGGLRDYEKVKFEEKDEESNQIYIKKLRRNYFGLEDAYFERRYYKQGRISTCWKDQSKVRKQYMKHERR